METTLPWSWYVDPEILRREQERIFRSAWQYAGHLGQLPEPGTFFTGRAGRLPVVVTRARDGEVRAFLNVCRHRGFPLADGEGRRETLQCPYHAWTYGLDGSLRAAPRSDEEPDFPQGGARALRGRGRNLGPVRVRQRRPRSGAARRRFGLDAGAGGRARPRRRRAAPPRPLGSRGGGELEDRLRELPRVLPLPGRASPLLRGDRRVGRGVRARCERAAVEPVRADPGERPRHDGRRGRAAAQPVPLPLAEPDREHLPRAGRTSPSARSSPRQRARRTASSTTSSAPTSTRAGSTS